MCTAMLRVIIAVAAILPAEVAQGEITVVGASSSHPGTLLDLGNGVGIPSKPPDLGEPEVVPKESPRPSPSSPGDARSVTRFGSPQPPNQLTPPPVLPFHPNRPLMPQSTPSSGGGRFNR